MKLAPFLAAFLLAVALASAADVNVVSPVVAKLDSGNALLPSSVADLGEVGPGQKLEIAISKATGVQVRGGEADWDQLFVVGDSLPQGWRGQDSLLYDNPLKAFVVVSPDAADGDYTFLLKTIDEYQGVPPVTFKAKASVSRDVFALSIAGEPVKIRSGATDYYQLDLSNKGSASDAFEITVSGLPAGEGTAVTQFVAHNSKATVKFPVSAPENGEYRLTFTGTSRSSSSISSRASTTLFVGSTLETDAKAAARGVLLFPTAQQLAYSLISLVTVLFS